MSEQVGTPLELVEIARLNGHFKKNYGTLISAYLYLRSISAARGRSYLLGGLLFVTVSLALAWLQEHGHSWLLAG